MLLISVSRANMTFVNLPKKALQDITVSAFTILPMWWSSPSKLIPPLLHAQTWTMVVQDPSTSTNWIFLFHLTRQRLGPKVHKLPLLSGAHLHMSVPHWPVKTRVWRRFKALLSAVNELHSRRGLLQEIYFSFFDWLSKWAIFCSVLWLNIVQLFNFCCCRNSKSTIIRSSYSFFPVTMSQRIANSKDCSGAEFPPNGFRANTSHHFYDSHNVLSNSKRNAKIARVLEFLLHLIMLLICWARCCSTWPCVVLLIAALKTWEITHVPSVVVVVVDLKFSNGMRSSDYPELVFGAFGTSPRWPNIQRHLFLLFFFFAIWM